MGAKSQSISLFFSKSKKSHFIVALVPTGINTGVVNLIPLRSISQTLAFHFCLSILNFSLDIIFLINKLSDLFYK